MSLTDIQKQFHDNADQIISRKTEKEQLKDKKKIQDIRHSMKRSQIGEILLNWADENDIKIVIDHQTTAGGYYYNGMKFIGISSSVMSLKPSTLAHEIMHAIQDTLGLLKDLENATSKELKNHPVQKCLSQTHFAEAAAYAIGDFVAEDCMRSAEEAAKKMEENNESLLYTVVKFSIKSIFTKRKNLPLSEVEKDLKNKFLDHFNNRYLLKSYENRELKTYAKILGVKNIIIPDDESEFDMPDLQTPYSSGVNLNDEAETRKIGDVLELFNFLDDLPKDFNRSAQFRKLTTDFSLNTDKVIEKSYQEKPEQIRKKNATLFRQVKHLQKNL